MLEKVVGFFYIQNKYVAASSELNPAVVPPVPTECKSNLSYLSLRAKWKFHYLRKQPELKEWPMLSSYVFGKEMI